ncbi:MAG: FAD-dependent oxidoreductase [Deltaproteobacteria bacterium]|nr:FAD-dependent oxidoreductase [Deltaproteobacteria bacterium]
MRIAVIGSGVSGLLSAALLARAHEVTLFEADDRLGGHTHTHRVERFGRVWDIDTGFIVFNERTYPHFIRLLELLGVESQPTTMSFSVRDERDGLEYNGTDLNRLFAQRRNLLRPRFLRMVRDILRFYREAPALLATADDGPRLGDWLARGRYSRAFVEQHLVPLGAAVWSADPRAMLAFPARYLVQFFANHGFLQVNDRPAWRVVRGGSRRYVDVLARELGDRVRLRTPVREVVRRRDGVRLRVGGGELLHVDAVVIATHSDQALALLGDARPAEREILGAMPYQANQAVLHTDARLLPRRRRAWAAWNYHVLERPPAAATVTYNMNLLQGLDAPQPFCVTLNRDADVDPGHVIARMQYHHPVITQASVAAQRRWAEINGVERTWFCGAYWGYGFHEDGVRSALAVAACFGLDLEALARPPRRAVAAAGGAA